VWREEEGGGVSLCNQPTYCNSICTLTKAIL
jgi:hypothetical protein